MGLPFPDGTLLGDLRHIVAVYRDYPGDCRLFTASIGLVGPETVVGLSVADIRKIHQLLESVSAVLAE